MHKKAPINEAFLFVLPDLFFHHMKNLSTAILHLHH